MSGRAERAESRADQQRDALEAWAGWWNQYGRRFYDHCVLPPLTATANALNCSICSGEDLGGERCQVCGRKG